MNCPILSPTTTTIKHTDNVPVCCGDRAHEFERRVCFEWVYAEGIGFWFVVESIKVMVVEFYYPDSGGVVLKCLPLINDR